jgi:hypothetical protein
MVHMPSFDAGGPLSPAEFESLRELSRGLKWKTIPIGHTVKLLGLGYAKDAVGGLVITDAGRLREALGS